MKTKLLIRKKNSDIWLCTAVVWLFLIFVINASLKTMIAFSDGAMFFYNILLFLFAAGCGLCFLVGIYLAGKLLSWMCLFSVMLIMFLSSAYVNGFSGDFLMERLAWLLIITGVYCALRGIKRLERLYVYFLKSTYLVAIVLILNFFVVYNGRNYDMTAGYYTLFVSFFHINELLKGKKVVINGLFSLGEVLIILVYASRGALLALIIYMLIKIFMEKKNRDQNKIIFTSLCIVLIISAFSFLFGGVQILLNEASGYTMSALKNGSFFKSSRTDIYMQTLELIQEKPLLGWGMGGEYTILGTYPHNLFLEILVDFGVVLGGLLILYIVIMTLKCFDKSNNEKNNLYLIFLCYGLIPAMLSGTWMQSWQLAIFMGLIRQMKCKRNVFIGPEENSFYNEGLMLVAGKEEKNEN